MSKNSKQSMRGLGAFLAAMVADESLVSHRIVIDPTSTLSEEEQIKVAFDKIKADHRAECPACAAEHAGDTVANSDKASGPVRDRILVGYMVFDNDVPVRDTLSITADNAESLIRQLHSNPIGGWLKREFGVPANLNVRPVYVD